MAGENLFHLAFPVHDLMAARDFYGTLLGCTEGRSAATWVDFKDETCGTGCTPVPQCFTLS